MPAYILKQTYTYMKMTVDVVRISVDHINFPHG